MGKFSWDGTNTELLKKSFGRVVKSREQRVLHYSFTGANRSDGRVNTKPTFAGIGKKDGDDKPEGEAEALV